MAVQDNPTADPEDASRLSPSRPDGRQLAGQEARAARMMFGAGPGLRPAAASKDEDDRVDHASRRGGVGPADTTQGGGYSISGCRRLMRKHLGRAVTSEPRRCGRRASRPRRHRPLRAEVLEVRTLMSTIVWENEGTPGRHDPDFFNQYFGVNAPVARVIVNQAIQAWEQVIVNFNYAHPGQAGYAPFPDEFDFSIQAYPLRGHNLAQFEIVGANGPNVEADRSGSDSHIAPAKDDSFLGPYGKPYHAVFFVDTNGGGHGWYFGLPSADTPTFTQVLTPFAALGDIGGREDFYSAVLREIGQAIGISVAGANTTLSRLTVTSGASRGPDPLSGPPDPAFSDLYEGGFYDRSTNQFSSAIFTYTGETGLYSGPRTAGLRPSDEVVSNDLMDAFQPVNTRYLISDIDVGLLAVAYPTETLAYPTDLGTTFLSVYDPSAQSLTTTADPRVGFSAIDLAASGPNLLVTLDQHTILSHTYVYPLSAIRSVTIDAGKGPGEVTLPGDLLRRTTRVNGGGQTTLVISSSPAKVGYVIETGRVAISDATQIALPTVLSNALASIFGQFSGDGTLFRGPTNIVTYSGVSRLTVRGDAGDRATVASTSAATPVAVVGVDSVTVGTGGSIRGVKGPVNVSGNGKGTIDLKIDDSADPVADSLHIRKQDVISYAAAPIGYAGADLRSLTVLGGPAADLYQVDDTPQNGRKNLAVALDTGPRDDQVYVFATSSDLTVDAGAGKNFVQVEPSAVSGLLSVQSLGGTYGLSVDDRADTRARHVTMGVLRIPVVAPPGSVVAVKNRLVGTIHGFGPGGIVYEPKSLTFLAVYAGSAGPGVAYPLGNTFSVGDTFVPAQPGASTSIVLGSADTVAVAATHGPLNVYGKDGRNTFQVGLASLTKRLDSLGGLVTVTNTGVNLLDQNAAAKEAVTVSANGVSVNGTQRVRTVGVAHVLFRGSGRGNAYDVQGTPGSKVFLEAGAGNDTFHVSGAGRSLDGFTAVSIGGGGGTDSLTVDDSGAPTSQTYDLNSSKLLGSTATSVQRQGGATVTALGIAHTSFFATDFGSQINVQGDSLASTLAVHGGAGNDTIALKGAARGAAISVDGGGGSNWLDYSGITLPAAIPAPGPLIAAPAGPVVASLPPMNPPARLALDAANNPGTITEFPVPTLNSQPEEITGGPDSNLWFTELSGSKIGRITPAGVVTEFTIPTAASRPEGITTGPDGALWFVERGPFSGAVHSKIGRITTAGAITEFPIPTFPSTPTGIATGSDGNLWFTEYDANRIGRITPSGTITEFPIPGFATEPASIAAGPDGNLWFTENNSMNIGRITPGGSITQFPYTDFTRDITAGPDGNLWFTDYDDGKIGRLTPATGGVTAFPGASGQDITAGPDGNLWFTGYSGSEIDQITPAGVVTHIQIPSIPSTPIGITTGPDGNLWFAEQYQGNIGRLVLHAVAAAPDLALTGSAPGSVVLGQNLAYSFTVTNGGTSGATGVTLTDTLPAGVTFVSATGGVTPVGGVLTFPLGNLAAGTSETVAIVVTPNAAGTLNNQAGVSGIEGDPTPADNTVTATTAVTAPAPTHSPKGVVVDLPLGKATGLGGGVSHIQNVIGSAFDDILVGNGGGILIGGPGRDLLIAGPAYATIIGGNGDNILVGGTTVSDRDLAALDAILADWSDSQADYATRVARLVAGGLAPGKAIANGQANLLQGGDGLDLFFAAAGDSTDRRQDETLVSL